MRLPAILGLVLFTVICTVIVIESYQGLTACPQVPPPDEGKHLPLGPRQPTTGNPGF